MIVGVVVVVVVVVVVRILLSAGPVANFFQ